MYIVGNCNNVYGRCISGLVHYVFTYTYIHMYVCMYHLARPSTGKFRKSRSRALFVLCCTVANDHGAVPTYNNNAKQHSEPWRRFTPSIPYPWTPCFQVLTRHLKDSTAPKTPQSKHGNNQPLHATQPLAALVNIISERLTLSTLLSECNNSARTEAVSSLAFLKEMAHYADLEMTPETLEEEKELAEAIGRAAHETARLTSETARLLKDDFVSDVTGTVERARTWLETNFPLLVLYQTEHEVFFEHVRALGVVLALVLVSFFVLSPWRRRGRKSPVIRGRMLQRSTSLSWNHSPRRATQSLGRAQSRPLASSSFDDRTMPQSLFATPGTTNERHSYIFRRVDTPSSPESASYGGVEDVAETEEEIYEQNYDAIYMERNYSRLLLPPVCRRIQQTRTLSLTKLPSSRISPQETKRKGTRSKFDKARASDKTSKSTASAETAASTPPKDRDNDNPAFRLQSYLQSFRNFMLSHGLREIIVVTRSGWTTALGIIVVLFSFRWRWWKAKNERSADPEESQESPEQQEDEIARTFIENEESTNERPVRITTKDDDTDASSALDTAMDEDGFSIARCASPHHKKENQELSANDPAEDDCFHTPTPTDLKVITQAGEGAPDLPMQLTSRASNTSGNADSKPPATVVKKTTESPFARVTHFFEAAHNQKSLEDMAVNDGPLPDENGYILGDDLLPSTQQTPLLVFVNSRSGPQQGQLLITQLRRLLNPIQVWDLADGEPGPILKSFCVLTKLRILVCGGDGSVSWIVNALEKLQLKRKWPPIGILPLGTGNDLARVLGWGGGYNNESLIGILEQISDSYTTLLDRWEMIITENGKKQRKDFFNYFGVGADAEAALQVHYLRESRPDWFFSRIVNKAWYGVFGAEDIFKKTSLPLHKEMKLYADGVEVPLPTDSQGIIVLNIDSYMGGIPVWSHGWRNPEHSDRRPIRASHGFPRRSASAQQFHSDGYPLRRSNSMGGRTESSEDLLRKLSEEERYDRVTACDLPASCQDGILEVVSIRSLFHLGQIRVGLSNAQRLCQCRNIKIVTRKKVAFQIDGEPWRQDKCELEIRRKPDPALMLHRSMEDGVETEMSKLLEWAEERKLIDATVHRALMKEFSRRIESKTRRRRSVAGGVLQNLTRRRISNKLSSGGPTTNAMMSSAASHPNSLLSQSEATGTYMLAPRSSVNDGPQSSSSSPWPYGPSF